MERRKFLTNSVIIGSGIMMGGLQSSTIFVRKKPEASDKIILGFIGLGSRNCFLIEEFIKQGAEVAYVCDVDTRRYINGINACKQQSKPPKTVQDFRRILDDKDVTAMVIAPGSHRGPLGTILSCQAGKDVYVEKPLSHDVYEGRKTVEAARKYKRIVQAGARTEVGFIMKKLSSFSKKAR